MSIKKQKITVKKLLHTKDIDVNLSIGFDCVGFIYNFFSVRAILQTVVRLNPELMGSSKKDLRSVKETWKKLVSRLEPGEKLQLIKSDFLFCYDNIRHEKMMEILQEVLRPYEVFLNQVLNKFEFLKGSS